MPEEYLDLLAPHSNVRVYLACIYRLVDLADLHQRQQTDGPDDIQLPQQDNPDLRDVGSNQEPSITRVRREHLPRVSDYEELTSPSPHIRMIVKRLL